MFDTLNLVDAGANATGRAEACDVYVLADCAMSHYGPVEALAILVPSSAKISLVLVYCMRTDTNRVHTSSSSPALDNAPMPPI